MQSLPEQQQHEQDTSSIPDVYTTPGVTGNTSGPLEMYASSIANISHPLRYQTFEGNLGNSSAGPRDKYAASDSQHVAVSANRAAESYHNLTFESADPDAGFFDMLYNSAFEQPPLSRSQLGFNRSANQSDQGLSDAIGYNSFTVRKSGSRSDHIDTTLTKVQRFWPGKPRSTPDPRFWDNIAFGAQGNIFTGHDINPVEEAADASEIELPSHIKTRLQDLSRKFKVFQNSDLQNNDIQESEPGIQRSVMDSAEIFDQGFYLYVHKYQPVQPILHLPTFDPEKVSTLLLLVMCTIGISFIKTEEAASFVRNIFPVCSMISPSLLQTLKR